MTQSEIAQTDQSIPVTLQLPKHLYQQAMQTADKEQCLVEDILSQVLARALNLNENRKHWQEISDEYCARLAKEGKSTQSPDKILQELSRVREKVAYELYPDELFS